MTVRKGDLTAADYYNLAEFRLLLRRYLTFSKGAAEQAGLTPQQHQALLAVKGHEVGHLTVGKLAESLMVRHNSAVGLVDRLARAGYVTRHSDEKDRRRVTLALTEKGEAVLSELSAAHREELRQLTPALRALFVKLER
ncbi:MAG: MarR family transcriptional regulator [Rhizomicrobium sp.]